MNSAICPQDLPGSVMQLAASGDECFFERALSWNAIIRDNVHIVLSLDPMILDKFPLLEELIKEVECIQRALEEGDINSFQVSFRLGYSSDTALIMPVDDLRRYWDGERCINSFHTAFLSFLIHGVLLDLLRS